MFLNNRLATFNAAFSRIHRPARRLIEARSTLAKAQQRFLLDSTEGANDHRAARAPARGFKFETGLPQFRKNRLADIRYQVFSTEIRSHPDLALVRTSPARRHPVNPNLCSRIDVVPVEGHPLVGSNLARAEEDGET
jgi:hypothetical protein